MVMTLEENPHADWLIYGKKGKFLDPVDKFSKKNFWEDSLKMEPETEISCHLSL
jgi:hypothetical protein